MPKVVHPNMRVELCHAAGGCPYVLAEPRTRNMPIRRHSPWPAWTILAVRPALGSVDGVGVLAVPAPALGRYIRRLCPVSVLASLFVRFGEAELVDVWYDP